MAISVVQSVKIPDVFSGSFASNVTVGNTVILVATDYNTATGSMSSSAPLYNGAAVTGAVKLDDINSGGTTPVYTAIWLLPNVATSSKTVSLTVAGGTSSPFAGSIGLIALEVSGLGTSPTLDKSNTAGAATGTAVTSGASGAITSTPELILSSIIIYGQALATVGAPWTELQFTNQYSLCGYQVVTSGSSSYTYSKTAPASAPWSGTIVTIKGTATSVTSTGTFALSALGASGNATETIAATGTFALPALGASGNATETIRATGTFALPALGASGNAGETIRATGTFALPALGTSGAVSDPSNVVSAGSFGMAALGSTGTVAEAIPPVTSTGTFALPALGATGPVLFGFGSVPGGAQGASGAGTLGTSGPAVSGSGSAPGGTQGASGSATFSTNTTGPGSSGDGGNSGGSNPGFDTITYPAWFKPTGDLDAKVELQIGGTWLDFSSRVLIGDTITYGRGHPDESTQTTASTFTGTLDNHDGILSSLNPYSPYFGLLGLNTPLRVSVPDASAHLRLENDSTSYANHPRISGLGSFEIWIDADADNWYRDQTLVSQWDDTVNGCSWYLNTLASGALELGISQDGVSGNAHWCVSFPLPIAHGRTSIRVTYDATSGQVVFYSGKYCRSWTATAYSGLPSGGVHATTASVELGYATNAALRGLPGFNGKIYAFALLGVLGGTIAANAVASIDFTALAGGVTSLPGGWTLQGGAEVSDRNFRFHGECGAWPQSWTPGDPNARIALSAGGLLRRLGSSSANVNSAMYRAYTNVTNAGVEAYWPFEDKVNATQLASALGGTPFRWYGATPSIAGFSGFNCSAPIVTLNKSALVGTVPSYAPTNAAVVRFLLNVPTGGDTSGTLATIYYSGGTLAVMNVGYTNGGLLGLSGWDAQGNKIFATNGIGFGADGALFRVSIELKNTGNGTYGANLVTLAPGANFGTQFPVAGLKGSVGAVSKIVFNPSGLLQSTSIGHVSVESVWTSLFDLGLALNAYQGELSGVRFQRLCTEEGIPFRGVGNILDTEGMGPQRIQSLTQLLQECVDADQGAWVEPRQVLGWGFRTRASMGNQYAAVEFDYNLDQLSDELVPTVDDQVIKNDITVSSADGSSSRQVLDDGSARSVGKIGRYDTTFTVNVDDSQLDSHAGWRLHALTVDEPRYKQIGVDLANAALVDIYWDILSADLGDRVTVQHPPVWLPPGLIDQLAQGANETIGLKALAVQWNGIPSTPWNVAYMDDVVFGRADTEDSVLSAGASAIDTTLSVWTNSGDLWTTDPAEFPFDIAVGGEQITVTGVTGTGSPQAFTVIRSVNGISKPQTSGSDVRLWTPAVESL